MDEVQKNSNNEYNASSLESLAIILQELLPADKTW
jgi:hypothetical protein